MPVNDNYLQYVLGQLSGLGRLSSRRMFSGIGLYCDGLFFALVFGDTLYFKVDDSNRGDYQVRGMSQFRPRADRSPVSLNYFEVPVDTLEDGEQLLVWARKSVVIAKAAAATKQGVGRARPRKRRAGVKKRRSIRGRKPVM
jgi:DNA transformation protein